MSNSKRKILYVVSTLERKGPTSQLLGLIRNLDREKFSPQVLTLSPEGPNSMIKAYQEAGIQVDSLNLSRAKGILVGNSKLRKAVREIAPDLIHTQGIRADNMVIALSDQYRHCNTIRNYAYDDYVMKFGKFVGTLFAKNHIAVIKNAKNPIACSKSIADRIAREHGITISYVQNGINAEQYSPVSPSEKVKLREELGIAQDKRVFIVSGTLSSRKDPLTALKAFRKANVADTAQLVLIGGGELQSECETYADASIRIVGFVRNVVDYLRASDVYLSTSLSEGLPNSVLEALGTGLPVILSDIEPHLEILEKCVDVGDAFQTGNENQLTELIRQYAIADLAQMSKLARQRVSENFTSQIMSAKYQQKYEEILSKRIGAE